MGTISDVETEFNTKPSPIMAHFSSRGPSKIEPAILKVDKPLETINYFSIFFFQFTSYYHIAITISFFLF